jgi:hypothetical protein
MYYIYMFVWYLGRLGTVTEWQQQETVTEWQQHEIGQNDSSKRLGQNDSSKQARDQSWKQPAPPAQIDLPGEQSDRPQACDDNSFPW